MQSSNQLPDITSTPSDDKTDTLQWVGMEDIAVPIHLEIGHNQQQTVVAKASVYVSLDQASAKGIHMSRLHARLNQLSYQTFTQETFHSLLHDMVISQAGISANAKVRLRFDIVLPKPSLLSKQSGFQAYPVEINGELKNNQHSNNLHITIPYSSTCPCSAALSRQLFADAIDNQFPGSNINKQALLSWANEITVATPHSQRSYAYLNLALANRSWPTITSIIMQTEEAIGTPVQTLVKRQDEQEFARLNASNLMFCEDAARKIKAMLEQSNWITDYWFKVEHQESLHAHNAVVIDQKFP